jgi:hypothetical protein
MHERSESFGGHLHVRSDKNAGTEVELRIPANVAYTQAVASISSLVRTLDVGRRDAPPGRPRFRKVWDGATIASDIAAEFIDGAVKATQCIGQLIRSPEAPYFVRVSLLAGSPRQTVSVTFLSILGESGLRPRALAIRSALP